MTGRLCTWLTPRSSCTTLPQYVANCVSAKPIPTRSRKDQLQRSAFARNQASHFATTGTRTASGAPSCQVQVAISTFSAIRASFAATVAWSSSRP